MAGAALPSWRTSQGVPGMARSRRDACERPGLCRAQCDRWRNHQRGPGRAAAGASAPRRAASLAFFIEELERFPGVCAGGCTSAAHRAGGAGDRARSPARARASPLRAHSSSATPPTSSTRSPARASVRHSAAQSWWRAQHRPALAGPRRGGMIARSAAYRRARWRTFAGKWAVERLIGYAMMVPGLFDHAVARIGRRRGMADTLVGVTGAVLPGPRRAQSAASSRGWCCDRTPSTRHTSASSSGASRPASPS